MVEDRPPGGERLEGRRIQLSRNRQRTAPVGIMEEVVKDLIHERSPRPDLHDLADAALLEIVEIPAQKLTRAGSNRDALQQTPALFSLQESQKPLQGPAVVHRPERAIHRHPAQALQKLVA